MALLNYKDISKRKISINNFNNEDKDSNTIYKRCKSYLEKVINTNIDENEINYNIFNNYLNLLKDSKQMKNNYSKPLNLIRICNENNLYRLSNKIFNEYNSNVCFFLENINLINSSLIDRYNLTDNQYKKLNETVNKIQISDRILKNHSIINERFKINNYIKEVPYKGLYKVLETVCPLLDTFNIPDYQRYSATIEECWYCLESNHISYDKSELISIISEYFMLSSDSIDNRSLKGFKKVLKTNSLLEDVNINHIKYITNPENQGSFQTISDYINYYLSICNKTIEDLYRISNEAIKNVSEINFKHEIGKLIWLYWKTIKFETFEDTIYDDIDSFLNPLIDNIIYSIQNREYSKSEIKEIYDNINKVSNVLTISNQTPEIEIKAINQFKLCLDRLNDRILDYYEIMYYEYNLDIINQINNSSNILPLEEFKIFKFHNLIAAAFRADKYLKNKEKKLLNSTTRRIKKKFKKVKDILFPENVDINYLLNNNGIVESCIAQYEYYGSSNDLQDYLLNTCKELNQQLVFNKNDDIKFYYIINPGIGEIHIASNNKIDLTEEESLLINTVYNESDNIYIENFANLVNYIDIMENLSIEDLLFRINETKNNLNSEELNVALEALEIFGIKTDIIQESSNSLQKSDNENIFYSIDMKLEAYDIFNAIMEKGAPKVNKPKVGSSNKSVVNNQSSNNKLDKDDQFAKENKFSGVNFNKIKLSLLGLKQKAKDFSQKERELSRNLDGNSVRFMKSLKAAMVSDRREAIIKGSVIPSFSKCIKIGIALAGSFVITGFNPITPIVLAIGGFAVSKNLTKKERVLLLDEIETELEVLEKEIQIAESGNKMKRLRALLKQKKELQRQYQRIKYNIRVGKDILPGSSVGVPNGND